MTNPVEGDLVATDEELDLAWEERDPWLQSRLAEFHAAKCKYMQKIQGWLIYGPNLLRWSKDPEYRANFYFSLRTLWDSLWDSHVVAKWGPKRDTGL